MNDLVDEIEKIRTFKALPKSVIITAYDYTQVDNIFELYKNKISEKNGSVEVINIHGMDSDISLFHSELSTIPMFGGARLIRLRHGDQLLKKIAQKKTVLAYYTRDLKNVPESTYLFFQNDEVKLPADFSFLNDYSYLIEQRPLYEKDLPLFVHSRVKSADFSIEPDAVEELVKRYSFTPNAIIEVLNKLFTYCINEKKIYKFDVEEVCHEVETNTVFNILDKIARRKITDALNEFNHYKLGDGTLFLNLAAKMFTEAFRYRSLTKAETGKKEIYQRLEFNTKHAYILKKNEERVQLLTSKYGEKELGKILEKLFDLDKSLKENNNTSLQKTIITIFIASLV